MAKRIMIYNDSDGNSTGVRVPTSDDVADLLPDGSVPGDKMADVGISPKKLAAMGAVTDWVDTTDAMTAAQMLQGVFKGTPTASRTHNTATATAIIAAFTSSVGAYFDFSVVNLTGATHPLVVGAGTGVTTLGSMTVAAATSGRFRIAVSGASTVDCIRLA